MSVGLGRLSFLIAFAALMALGCSNPAAPVSPSIGTTSTSVSSVTGSVIAPRPLQPANSALVKNADQPVTLIVQNAVVTRPGGTTYTFEFATDAAFTTNVQRIDGVAEGAGGQTSLRLGTLTPDKDYYWHVRAVSAGTTGVFGAIYKFTVGPAIVINAPVPIAPLTNAQTFARPALRVTNATRQGPAGPITYKFEIATTSTFSSIIVTGNNIPEGINETGVTPTTDLPSTGTLFWRATAIDAANGVTSSPSTVQSFTANKLSQAALVAAQLGVTLWPGVQPPGSNGHAIMGRHWNVEPLVSFTGVTFMNPPLDEVQIFDLLDRGFDPAAAVDWMHANGYPTIGVWYPAVQVLAFEWEYIAYINGQWDIVVRVGA